MAGIRTLRIVLVLAAAAALAAVAMNWENTFLYFPSRELSSSPKAHGLSAEELRLTAEDGVHLYGWRIHGGGRRAVLFFHGNAGNVADRLDRARILAGRLGLDVFLVDYRGYGRSEGSPSEPGLVRDARAVYAAASERGFGPERIILFGESLGSAVAVALAATRPCAGVILETPFLSIREMARRHYPFVPAMLLRTRFDNAGAIGRVAVPKLFLIAGRDEIVPPEQGRRLFELAPPPKDLYVIPGAGHNDTYDVGGERYWQAIERFLAGLP